MKAQSLTLAGALVLSTASFAQTDASADILRYDASRTNYAGVYDVATQQFRPSANSGLSRNAGVQLSSYSQDWEAADINSPTAVSDDGWLGFVNVFDGGGGFLYGYFTGGAPNGGPGLSAIGTGDGGAAQGAQYLNVYSDYNNGDHASGLLIEANVFKEQTIGAADVGDTWTFQFDHLKNPQVFNGDASTTTQAFIKVLQSSNGSFAQLAFNTFDTTSSSTTAWATDSIDITIDPSWVGELLQIGFMSTATNYDDTGRFYDNLSLNRTGVGLGEPIYNNTAPTGFFYNIIDGRKLIDEGVIPRPSTASLPGTFDSYDLSSLALSYVTDATDPSLGGTGVGIEIEIYESYDFCTSSAGSETPAAVISLTGLPGSTSGGLTGFNFDIDLTSLGICLRAEGRDGLANSAGPRFGWSYRVTDAADATSIGPFIAGDPNVAPEGDGTTFQNPGLPGTGLGTVDAFYSEGGAGAEGCFFFGGYPGGPFASFAIILRSKLLGDCVGCGLGDDNFEENDDAASAAPIGLGATNGLVQNVDADFFTYTIPDGQNLRIDALFTHAISDLDMYLRNSAGTVLDQGFSGSDNETVSYSNCTGAPEQLFIEIDNFGGACNEYDLVLSEVVGLTPDALEENDDCLTAVPLPLGLTRGLNITEDSCTGLGDFDYYSIQLADGDTLAVDILFSDAVADLDLFAYDTALGCDGGTQSPGTLDFGFSSSDNENIRVTNTTGAALDIVVRVDRFGSGENTYEMIATVTTGENYGTVICSGNDNSIGDGTRLIAIGSDVASDNALTLDASGAPAGEWGLFFASQGFIPVDIAGSEGTLCIGSLTIARFNDSLVATSGTGTASYSPDLTSIPFENGGTSTSLAIVAGDSLNFQFWHRDVTTNPMMPPSATSNLSDAIQITFQ